MNELAKHLKEENFTELKARLKKCTTQAEQRKLVESLDARRLDEFTAWLLADGNAVAALHVTAIGVALRRQLSA
jgi:hypothetical protein